MIYFGISPVKIIFFKNNNFAANNYMAPEGPPKSTRDGVRGVKVIHLGMIWKAQIWAKILRFKFNAIVPL